MTVADVLAGRADWAIDQGDVLERLAQMPGESVNCVVTSPPYWGLRDYGVAGQIGLEATPDLFVGRMVAVFAEVRRVMRKDATLWLNLGDSYAGAPKGSLNGQDKSGLTSTRTQESAPVGFDKTRGGLKEKDLVGIPWRVAFALQADGYYLRSDIVWAKPNPMPESITDRPTKAHEYLFLLSRSARYHYDAEAIREPAIESRPPRVPDGWAVGAADHSVVAHSRRTRDKQRGHGRRHVGFNDRWDAMPKAEQQAMGRNKRTVWTIATEGFPEAHFATFPTALVEPCVLAGCPVGGVVLDPFCGSGTALLVSLRHGRRAVGLELNPAYVEMARRRVEQDCPMFNQEAVG